MLLPLSAVLTAFARFLPTVLVYVPVHIVAGLPVGPELLWAFPLLYFRDLKNFVPYLLRVWLYASPVLYYPDEVPGRYAWLIALNPLGGILSSWSEVINKGHAPEPKYLALAVAWSFGIFLVGALFFISREREFAVRL